MLHEIDGARQLAAFGRLVNVGGAQRVWLDADLINEREPARRDPGDHAARRRQAPQQRRALRLRVEALSWRWEAEALVLEFGLANGAFATSVLRELAALRGGDDAAPVE